MIYTIVGIIMLLLIICYTGYYFSRVVLYPKALDYDETFKWEVKEGNIVEEYFKNLQKEEVFIQSQYGYKLHAIWIPFEESKKTIVFCHGITYNLFGSIKYMDIFYKQGFNVFVYDHRFHGKSGGDNCTFGFYEKYDLKTCIDWVLDKVGKDSIVGTHGESMGAATVLQHGAIDNRVAFIIADCPYESASEEFKYRLKIEYKLPAFPLLNIASVINKIKTNAFYREIAPIKNMAEIETPILFIHGDSDHYVPCSHSVNMHNVKKGIKKLYLTPGAGHAKSFSVNKEQYGKNVLEFLESINII